jgi:MMP 1-O-methyltransferase
VPLPKAIRRLTPDRIRDDVRLRAAAVGSGLIPPRTMHSAGESALLAELAAGRRSALEIGVYEGSSAVVLARTLPEHAVLHLIDPFIDDRGLRSGQRATGWATKRVVARAAKERGDRAPRIVWHVARSEDVGPGWREPLDLVFVDGDHAEAACRSDWELFSPWVVQAGVVVFHDANKGKPGADHLPNGGGHPGPTAVVDELFRGAGGPPDGWRVLAERDTAVAVERVAPR